MPGFNYRSTIKLQIRCQGASFVKKFIISFTTKSKSKFSSKPDFKYSVVFDFFNFYSSKLKIKNKKIFIINEVPGD